MRVLFLTHRIPYPPNKGDKIRSYHILNYLVKSHEVYLGSLIDDQADHRFVADIETRVAGFVFAPIHPRRAKLGCLRSLIQHRSISVCYFYARTLQRKLDDLLEKVQFDAILCFSSPMAEYVFRRRQEPSHRPKLLMDFIDVDSYKWRQYAERKVGPMAPVYRYEANRLARYERKIATAFDQLFVVSDQERAMFPGNFTNEKLTVMPNGVDLDFFRPRDLPRQHSTQASLAFTGVMDYWPNIEGVEWFVASVLPRIKLAVPGVTFYVVGARPSISVRRLQRLPDVVVTGFVDDIRRYLAAADVCVVPLRIARGIQNKVLEAMAMGKPVVATPQALEGIRALPDENVVSIESEQGFAAAVIDLLNNPDKASAIGSNARKCMEQFYCWERNLEILDRALQTTQTDESQ